MLPGKYRLTEATISVVQGKGRDLAHSLAIGSIITVPLGTDIDGNKLVQVICEGSSIMMFAQDLRARGVYINA